MTNNEICLKISGICCDNNMLNTRYSDNNRQDNLSAENDKL